MREATGAGTATARAEGNALADATTGLDAQTAHRSQVHHLLNGLYSTPAEDAWLHRLDRLTEAAHIIEAMQADAVTRARTAGHSWAKIGNALGMTKQAAQQRYGSRPTPTPDPAQLTIDHDDDQHPNETGWTGR